MRTKDLQHSHSYKSLAEFCRSNGREEEALRWAEEGIWVFEDGKPDETLVLYAAGLLSKAGRAADAEAHLWRAFGKAPSMALYHRLAGSSDGARDRALALLAPLAAREKPAAWGGTAELIVRILAHEKAYDQAWETARKHRLTMGVKLDLARATEATHPGQALEVYADRVRELVDVGSSQGAYEEAVKLIRHMAGLRDEGEQSAYVAALKERFGRKRNFMKLLG
ncbi:hypothetical protein AB4144_03635 [Rhizobiaceae sp. 2RAB30]